MFLVSSNCSNPLRQIRPTFTSLKFRLNVRCRNHENPLKYIQSYQQSMYHIQLTGQWFQTTFCLELAEELNEMWNISRIFLFVRITHHMFCFLLGVNDTFILYSNVTTDLQWHKPSAPVYIIHRNNNSYMSVSHFWIRYKVSAYSKS